LNKTQIEDIEHSLRNGNRFYTEAKDKNWNELVEKRFATKHPGWEEDMAYFRVTGEGKSALAECKQKNTMSDNPARRSWVVKGVENFVYSKGSQLDFSNLN
jgi:hypothetical protein